MRVALLTCNAQTRNAIGNQVAEKLAFFLERGAEVRVFLESALRVHADLGIADYAQCYDRLHCLPLLAGRKPRLVLDYHGVTPAQHWQGPQRDLLEQSARQRAIVWCAEVAFAHSEFAKDELHRATG